MPVGVCWLLGLGFTLRGDGKDGTCLQIGKLCGKTQITADSCIFAKLLHNVTPIRTRTRSLQPTEARGSTGHHRHGPPTSGAHGPMPGLGRRKLPAQRMMTDACPQIGEVLRGPQGCLSMHSDQGPRLAPWVVGCGGMKTARICKK